MILRGDDDDDGREIADVFRSFLQQHSKIRDAPVGPRVDRDLWTRACRELGIAAVDVPESLAGLGAGFGALAAVIHESGRVLARLPLLSSVVAAQHVIVASGDEAAQVDLLPGLLDGSVIAAAVLETDLGTLTLSGAPDAPTLSGHLDHVMDGVSADLMVVAVQSGQGTSVVAFRLDATGVTRTTQRSMDLTRDFATIELLDVAVYPIGAAGGMDDVLREARRRVATTVACEQLAGSEKALEDAIAFAKTRIQFGREIASFQAIKHRCADLAIDVDSLRSAVAHAVWAVATGASGRDTDAAISIAAATGSRVHLRCALENVQIHGGIGFTWEHSAHLHVRRAESHVALHGDEVLHLERVAQAWGI